MAWKMLTDPVGIGIISDSHSHRDSVYISTMSVAYGLESVFTIWIQFITYKAFCSTLQKRFFQEETQKIQHACRKIRIEK